MVSYLVEERNPRDAEVDEIIALINRVWLDAYRDVGFFRFDRQVFDWYGRASYRYGSFYQARETRTGRLIGFGIGMPRATMIHGEGPWLLGYAPADHERLLCLMNGYGSTLDLARVWDLEELGGYYANPIVHGKLLEQDGEVRAVIHASVLPFSIKGKTRPLALFENLHYDGIPYPDQRLLVRALLHDLKAEGVAFAGDFGIGYSSQRALRANRFLKYDRKMTLYFLPSTAADGVADKLRRRCAATYIDIR